MAGLRPIQRERAAAPSLQIFYGHGVYGPEGRRLGVLRGGQVGRPGSNHPYAVVELSSFSRSVSDLRAIPLSSLTYDEEFGRFVCGLQELSVRSAPAYSGAADWFDDRWTRRLDDYFDRLAR